MGTITKWDDASGFIWMNTTAIALPFGGKVEVGGLIGINLHSPIEPGASGVLEFHDGHTFAWIDKRNTVLAAPLNVGDAYLAEDTTSELGFVVRNAAIGDTCVYYAGKSTSAGGGGVTTIQMNTAIANARNFTLIPHNNAIALGVPPTGTDHPSPTNGDVARTLNTATGVIETWRHDGTTWNSIHQYTPGGSGSTTKIVPRTNATANIAPSVVEFPAPTLGDQAYVLLNDGSRELWDHNGATWNRTSQIAAPSASSNVMLVSRGNDTLNVAPTLAEFAAPTAGAQALVRMNDGSSEVWDHNGVAWSRTDLHPGQNAVIVTRAAATQNVAPTALEVPNPINKTQAFVRLPDGASEFWQHDGTTWTRLDIIAPGGGEATFFINRVTDAIGPPSVAEVAALPSTPTAGDNVLVITPDGTRVWYETTDAGVTWNQVGLEQAPIEWREFAQAAHGLNPGDRVYVDAAGNLVVGDSSTGEQIPRMIVSATPDANTVRVIPNGGDWYSETAAAWDLTNAGAAGVTNSRYAKTQDDNTLGHDSGTLDNVERYFVRREAGTDNVWILLPGRPIDGTLNASQDPVHVVANGTPFTNTTENNIWFVDPGVALTAGGNAAAGVAAPTTLQLRPVGEFSSTQHSIVKNASTQIITLQAQAGEFIEGFSSVTLNPSQSFTLRRSIVANNVAVV